MRWFLQTRKGVLSTKPMPVHLPKKTFLKGSRLAGLLWGVSHYESVLADVDSNVSHNYKEFNISYNISNIVEPSLQIRGQSPVNCPASDVKVWGQNISNCLMTNGISALFHTLTC